MSDSSSCEFELRQIADKLHAQAYELEAAADALLILRNADYEKDKIATAKNWAKSWLSR